MSVVEITDLTYRSYAFTLKRKPLSHYSRCLTKYSSLPIYFSSRWLFHNESYWTIALKQMGIWYTIRFIPKLKTTLKGLLFSDIPEIQFSVIKKIKTTPQNRSRIVTKMKNDYRF